MIIKLEIKIPQFDDNEIQEIYDDFVSLLVPVIERFFNYWTTEPVFSTSTYEE